MPSCRMQPCKVHKAEALFSCRFHELQKTHECMLDKRMNACYLEITIWPSP